MVLKLIKRAILGRRRYAWDKEYSQGDWEYLKDHLEEGRFEAVRFFVDKYSHHGKILEVGCGVGLLQAKINKDSYLKYIGIDISKVSIKKASHLKDKSVSFQYGDMENYVPSEKFDIIIFNESLYYAKDPVQLMARYFKFLNPASFLIISIYETAENRRVMSAIGMAFQLMDEKITTNERGTWYCQVYSNKG